MAGVLNGSMGIVGPPVILFYFSSPTGVVAGRASIVAYFIGTDSVGAAMFAAQGLIDASVNNRYWPHDQIETDEMLHRTNDR